MATKPGFYEDKFDFHQSQQEFPLASSAVEYEDLDASDMKFGQLG